MVVDDLNVLGTAGEITFGHFQPIVRWGSHIIEGCCSVEHIEFAWGDVQHLGW